MIEVERGRDEKEDKEGPNGEVRGVEVSRGLRGKKYV